MTKNKKIKVSDIFPENLRVHLNLKGVRYFPSLMIRGAPDEKKQIYCGFCRKPHKSGDDDVGLYVSPTDDMNVRLYMCPDCRKKHEVTNETDTGTTTETPEVSTETIPIQDR
jgi:hypothetical protein